MLTNYTLHGVAYWAAIFRPDKFSMCTRLMQQHQYIVSYNCLNTNNKNNVFIYLLHVAAEIILLPQTADPTLHNYEWENKLFEWAN